MSDPKVLQSEQEFISPDFDAYSGMKPLIQKPGIEPLSDEDLMRLHAFYKDLDEKLCVLGPTFGLAEREVQRRHHELEGYRRSRLQHIRETKPRTCCCTTVNYHGLKCDGPSEISGYCQGCYRRCLPADASD